MTTAPDAATEIKPAANAKKPKRYLRRNTLATRYDTSPRNVDRMARDGRLPPPDLYIGKTPLWLEEKLDVSDREAMRRGRREKALA